MQPVTFPSTVMEGRSMILDTINDGPNLFMVFQCNWNNVVNISN
ncbi:hypothetical protein Xoosp13_390 [Xanthomonas phage Xoo-sp13]|nr:hypothetical protein Xoosp13_390 [Xanthomonas phage Xoo-sp13]